MVNLFRYFRRKRIAPLEELSADNALIQAAEVLNVACSLANENKDAATLGELSERWFNFGLAINEMAAQAQADEKDKNRKTGFYA
jgi:hypothetical protein